MAFTLDEIVKEFDDSTTLSINSEQDFLALLRARVPKGEELTESVHADLYAFSLYEDNDYGKEVWKTYFGTPMVRTLDDKVIEVVPFQKITQGVVEAWEQRARQCNSPFLKARYAGLVWEFSFKVKGVKPSMQEFGMPYIKALIEISCLNIGLYSFSVFKKLERALDLSIRYRHNITINATILAIRNYEKKVGVLEKPGLWRYSFELIVMNKGLREHDNLVVEIVDEMEGRFNKLIKPNERGGIDLNGFNVAGDKLIEYYIAKRDTFRLKRVIDKLRDVYNSIEVPDKVFHALHNLERLHSLYEENGFKDDAEAVLIKLQGLYPKTISEMKLFRFEFDIDRDIVNVIAGSYLSSDAFTTIKNFSEKLLPDKGLEIADNLSERSFYEIVSKGFHDYSGRKVSDVGSSFDDLEGNYVVNISRQLSIGSIFLHFGLKLAKEKGVLTKTSLGEYFHNSPYILKERLPIFELIVSSYLSEDYITALHLMVPQIEACCLNIVQFNSGLIMKAGRHGGFNVRVLEGFLTDEVFKSVTSESVSMCLRVIFTDQRGWNIRNRVSHGITSPDLFTFQYIDRVFLSLLYLANPSN